MLKLNVWKFRLRDDQFDHPGADSHGELSSVSVFKERRGFHVSYRNVECGYRRTNSGAVSAQISRTVGVTAFASLDEDAFSRLIRDPQFCCRLPMEVVCYYLAFDIASRTRPHRLGAAV